MTETSPDTFILTFDSHDFVFRKLTSQHLTMWSMYLKMWRKRTNAMVTDEQKSAALDELIARALDVAQDKLVNVDDKELIMSKLLMGRFDYSELFAVFRNGTVTEPAPEDDADPKPAKKQARKTAARKAPARRVQR